MILYGVGSIGLLKERDEGNALHRTAELEGSALNRGEGYVATRRQHVHACRRREFVSPIEAGTYDGGIVRGAGGSKGGSSRGLPGDISLVQVFEASILALEAEQHRAH